MKRKMLILTLIIFGFTPILAVSQIGSAAPAAVEAAGLNAAAPSTAVEEFILITSAAGDVKRIGPERLTEGFSMADPYEMLPYEVHNTFDRKEHGYSSMGTYEMRTLPTGAISINFKSQGCKDGADAVNEKAAGTSHTVSLAPVLIVPSELVHRIRHEPLAQEFTMAGPLEMLPYEVHRAYDRQEQRYAWAGLYEAWGLPNGDVVIKLHNNGAETC